MASLQPNITAGCCTLGTVDARPMRKLGVLEINGFELMSPDLNVPRNKLLASLWHFEMRKAAT